MISFLLSRFRDYGKCDKGAFFVWDIGRREPFLYGILFSIVIGMTHVIVYVYM